MTRTSSDVLSANAAAEQSLPISSGRAPLPSRIQKLLTEIRWLVFAALAAFLFVSLLTYSKQDPGWSHSVEAARIFNQGGRVGAWFADLMLLIFGISSYWFCVLVVERVVHNYRNMIDQYNSALIPEKKVRRYGRISEQDETDEHIDWVYWLGFVSVLLSSMGLEALRFYSLNVELPKSPGGVFGELIANALSDMLGFTSATLFLLLIFISGVSLFFRFSWLDAAEKLGGVVERLFEFAQTKRNVEIDKKVGVEAVVKRVEVVEKERTRITVHDPVHIEPPLVVVPKSERVEKEKQAPLFVDMPDSSLPPLALLDTAPIVQETVSAGTLEFTSRLIEKKLKDFGVEVVVTAAYPGPVVTRYEIEPATGVKGSQIVNLAKDLARSLSLVSIRVVETIPGKNCMGLELPNPKRQAVRLTEILSSEVYNANVSPLTLALGKDIAGRPVVADLAKMPHCLVAGTTGSGKSVGINAMILSVLYKASADQVRLILIDPKMLEMSVYEGIPHLLAPVVTDMRQAANALNWAVAEMERRYKLMSKMGVRNLAGYNNKILDAAKKEEKIPNPFSLTPESPEPLETLPVIVVVIDELADLMMVVGKKIEELIARIAQKARAAGIHLVLATQRPSVDVITGLIKANIPTRIAFQVSSKIDSRTILDQMGAEALLGMGDMLYMPSGSGLPQRVHGAFVSDEEVHRVVEHLKKQAEIHGGPNYIEGILEGGSTDDGDGASSVTGIGGDAESDPMYDQAVDIVLKNKKASISLVQRHLRIGYNRAARLLEQMEKSGLVSTMSTSGNREIIAPNRAVDA
ncbi:DNA translocase FtsK [Ampullimonas aquatilis]|uniref:DNA translocase FtsK n=1 Tax=Ampullimonas aquatilis TaxID=1341549 RepID=UPI003C78F5AF